MTDLIHLTILIPAFNESKRLPSTLNRIQDYCGTSIHDTYEILVIDDGSTDQTAQLVREMGAQNPNLTVHRYAQNHGKGYALRTGMRLARGRFVLFMDADLSTPIEEMQHFLPKLNDGAQVVIASRKSAGANITRRQPFLRETMGKTFTWLSNTILGLQFTDFTCGFKAFESAAGKDLFARQQIDGWAYDSEILFLAVQQGYRVQEVPVTWVNSADTKVRLLRDVFSSLKGLIQIRWYWATGRYSVEKSRESGRIPADV
jgi:dolichyl-phosphate beta-glucosyltransferase